MATRKPKKAQQATNKLTFENAIGAINLQSDGKPATNYVLLRDVLQRDISSRHEIVVAETLEGMGFTLHIEADVFARLLMHLANHDDWMLAYSILATNTNHGLIKAARNYQFARKSNMQTDEANEARRKFGCVWAEVRRKVEADQAQPLAAKMADALYEMIMQEWDVQDTGEGERE